jgi:hypothetical protein
MDEVAEGDPRGDHGPRQDRGRMTSMTATDAQGDHDRRADAVDALIRRRFRNCDTMPLFPDRAPSFGFFELSDIGQQSRMFDLAPSRSGTPKE